MAGVMVLHICYVLLIVSEALSANIRTQPTVFAAAGEQVSLFCQLSSSGATEEIKWQKVLPDGEETLASFHKQHGRRVNPEFEGEVEFELDELHTCSVVMKLTKQNEGCYRCIFKANSEDALTNTTCVWIYELHEPVLHVRAASSPEESVVWCSATGGPAPTVTLTVPQQHLHFSQYNSTRVTNSNNTVTVTTTAVLSGLHDDSTQVGCAARVDSGPQMEVLKRISELKHTSDDEKKISDSDENSSVFTNFLRSPFLSVLPWSFIVFVPLAISGILWLLIIYLPKLICHFAEKIFEEPED